MELSVAEFKKVLGEDFNELKGTFEEQKFDGLLNELQFKQSILGRSKLRNVLNRRDSLKKVKYRLQKLLSPLKVGKVIISKLQQLSVQQVDHSPSLNITSDLFQQVTNVGQQFPNWFTSKECPTTLKRSLAADIPTEGSAESEVQKWWTKHINNYFSEAKSEQTLTMVDAHTFPTIGTHKPDCPMYAKSRTQTVFNLVSIGELKKRRGGNVQDFSNEEKGHILQFALALIQKQPWRNRAITTFLSDGKYIQFFLIEFETSKSVRNITETSVLELSNDGGDWLYGLLCADLVALGWELPSVTLNGEKLSIVNFLGQGGSSRVFEAQSNSGRVVIKKYLPGPNTRDIRDNEVAMLRYTAECGNITKLVDAQPMLLILKPVGVHFAVGARQTTIAHSEDNRLLITSTLICQLLNILEKLHNKFKIVHRDIKLSNIFVHNNQILLNDFGAAVKISKTPVQFYGALRHAPNSILKMLASNVEPKTYYPHPHDDLIMVVKMMFQALCPATFEFIQCELNATTLLHFWEHYFSCSFWSNLVSAATRCDYKGLKEEAKKLFPETSWTPVSNLKTEEENEERREVEEEILDE